MVAGKRREGREVGYRIKIQGKQIWRGEKGRRLRGNGRRKVENLLRVDGELAEARQKKTLIEGPYNRQSI